jgi:hypothetical protein
MSGKRLKTTIKQASQNAVTKQNILLLTTLDKNFFTKKEILDEISANCFLSNYFLV